MVFLRKCVAVSAVLALLCLSLAACDSEKQELQPVPAQGGKPILQGAVPTEPSPNDYSAVYVTVFEDTAYIASYPVLQNPDPDADPEKKDPVCAPRELSGGGTILCGEHEGEDRQPITRVLILDQLVPRSMAGWFRDLFHLEEIIGLEKIKTHHVTDMSNLFAGCGKLKEINIDGWDVSNVTDFTDIFKDCIAYSTPPSWYEPENNSTLG